MPFLRALGSAERDRVRKSHRDRRCAGWLDVSRELDPLAAVGSLPRAEKK